MATERLQVILEMAAGQYKREAKQAAAATSSISKEAKTAATQTGGLSTKMGSLGAILKGGLVAGGALAATDAIVEFGKASVDAAVNLEESINAVNVTFGDSADQIHAIGETAADSFGLAQSEFNQFAVRFSAFAENIAQSSGRDVASVIEDMTTRVADFASVHNLALEEAALVASSTLAGETESFRRFGGDVSAAAVEMKGLELGLSGVGDELTEGEKQLVRYELFMEQTAKTAGDFANTQDSLANATRTLSANFEEFKARIGSVIVPVLSEVAATGINVLDILGENPDLSGWERLTATLSLVTGRGNEVTAAYIAQAQQAFILSDANREVVAVTEESIGAANRHRGAIDAAAGAEENAAEAFEGTKLEIQKATDAIRAYDDAFRRLTDPVFRHLDDQRQLQQAYDDYNTVMGDAEASTRDQEAALFELLGAQQEVNSSGAALPETMGRTEQAFLELADQLGLTEEQTNDVREALEGINGKTYRADIIAFFKVGGSQSAYDAIRSGDAVIREGVITRQHGGPVWPNQTFLVGEREPELFVPNTAGQIVPMHRLAAAAAGSSGPTIYVGTVYGFDDFSAKVRDAGINISRLGG